MKIDAIVEALEKRIEELDTYIANLRGQLDKADWQGMAAEDRVKELEGALRVVRRYVISATENPGKVIALVLLDKALGEWP